MNRRLNDLCVMNLSDPVSIQQDVVRQTEWHCCLLALESELLFLTPPKTFALTSTSRFIMDDSRSQPVVAPLRGSSEMLQGGLTT